MALCTIGTCLSYTIAVIILLQLNGVSASRLTEERLIGWRGDTYQPKRLAETPSTDANPWIQTISTHPRAQIYHNFLSEIEIDHILQLSRHQMKRSMVVGPNDTGVIDSYRTSAGTFLRRNQDPVIAAIEQRVAMWTHVPPIHQEDMQVLRYGVTNNYGPHMDGFGRIITVLMYLVEPEEGGETTFTNSEWADPAMAPADDTLSACAKGHVAFKPKRGDALLFFDRKPDYKNEDPHGMHTGCPVVVGVKWNAVKWLHGVPFQPESYLQSSMGQREGDAGLCEDLDSNCEMWAQHGECKRNPGFMLGKPDGAGRCRKACGDCEVCAEGDETCMDRNRQRGGFMVISDAELAARR